MGSPVYFVCTIYIIYGLSLFRGTVWIRDLQLRKYKNTKRFYATRGNNSQSMRISQNDVKSRIDFKL